MAGQFAFPPQVRVRKKADFERAFERGVRLADGRLAVWCVQNGLEECRLGLVIGRKHGCAVRRNRLKRRVRESFRLLRPSLPAGIDLLVSPHAGREATQPEITASLAMLVPRVHEKLARRAPGAGG